MTAPSSIDLTVFLHEQLAQVSPDLLRQMLTTFINTLMSAEADAVCGAEYGTRSAERTNHRDGYRPRQFDTRAGTLEVAIPKLLSGSYFPDWLLERRRRAERALTTVVATCYLLGVSTRRMERLVESLGITRPSKSQVSEMAKDLDQQVEAFRSRPLDAGPYTFVAADALVLKVREGGRVVNVHALVATGVNADGHREILGLQITSAEDGAGWLAFFRDLTARGLTGVALVTSDAPRGLVEAIGAAVPGPAWQRRVHFLRNMLARVSKGSAEMVAAAIRTIFAQPTADTVREATENVASTLDRQFPAVARLLRDAREKITAFADFPQAHWRKIWSTNPLERLNKEVKRRTDVGIFPDDNSLLRLAGCVPACESTPERHYCRWSPWTSHDDFAQALGVVLAG
jgi:putative transposase